MLYGLVISSQHKAYAKKPTRDSGENRNHVYDEGY